MAHDGMADAMSETLMLKGKKGDLAKHVGHKVTVTGTDAPARKMKDQSSMDHPMPTLAVTRIVMVAASCGM